MTLLAIALCSLLTIEGKLEYKLEISNDLREGSANRYGVILGSKSVVQYETDRFRAKDSSIYTTSPSLTKANQFKAGRMSGILEAFAGGFVIGDQLVDQKGQRLRYFANIVVNGINAKGDVAGYSKDPTSRLDRATAIVSGDKRFVSYPAASDYIAPVDQFLLFSQAFDIDDEGRILATSLPPKARIYKDDALRPYLIEKGKQSLLPSPFETADVYPLGFAFDGSIIGMTYTYSTIVESGWSGGFGQATSTMFMRWKWAGKKLMAPSVSRTQNGFTLWSVQDASGPYVVGLVRNESTKLHSPALWVNSKLTNVKIRGKVSIDKYLGFVSANTVACLGDVNGKWSLFTVILPNPKSGV